MRSNWITAAASVLLAILTCVAAAITAPVSEAVALAPIFAPYVDFTEYPAPNLAALRSRSGVKAMTIAFVTARGTSGCVPSWGGYPQLPASGSHPYRRSTILAAQRAGTSLAVSFGGEAGAELATRCATPTATAAAYDAVIAAYHPNRIDFDIEGAAVADPASIDRRSRALAIVQRHHPHLPISLTLPVLPTGLDADGRTVVRSAYRHHVGIAYVNLMTMDYGDSAAPKPADRMGAYAIAAAQATAAQLHRLRRGTPPAQIAHTIGITPMIGINDVADEVFTVTDAQLVAAYAAAHGYGLLSDWQLERDRQCTQPTTRTQNACSGVAQTPFQFARAF